MPPYSAAFVAWVRGLPKSKRADAAIEILLERGTVTTKELQDLGYDHPPRALGDLKDAGVPFTSRQVIVDGTRMAEYTLIAEIGGAVSTRKPIPKSFREQLFELHGHRCAVCGGKYEGRYLQADHRVPYRIGGDPDRFGIAEFVDFMPPPLVERRSG